MSHTEQVSEVGHVVLAPVLTLDVADLLHTLLLLLAQNRLCGERKNMTVNMFVITSI